MSIRRIRFTTPDSTIIVRPGKPDGPPQFPFADRLRQRRSKDIAIQKIERCLMAQQVNKISEIGASDTAPNQRLFFDETHAVGRFFAFFRTAGIFRTRSGSSCPPSRDSTLRRSRSNLSLDEQSANFRLCAWLLNGIPASAENGIPGNRRQAFPDNTQHEYPSRRCFQPFMRGPPVRQGRCEGP